MSQSLDAGHDVTAYVRHPDKIAIPRQGLSVVMCQIDDDEALARSIDVAGLSSVEDLHCKPSPISG